MPQIEQLLALAEVSRSDIEAVAVSIGPGSFTGLRIGLSTAKAIAYGLGIPLVGVPTLQALAFGCAAPGALQAPTLDAQKGNFYLALYAWRDGAMVEIAPPQVVSLAEMIKLLQEQAQPALVQGEAVDLHREQLCAAGLALALPHTAMPRAASVAVLGGQLLAAGVWHDGMHLEPIYIRRAEAEELWEKRHNGCQTK